MIYVELLLAGAAALAVSYAYTRLMTPNSLYINRGDPKRATRVRLGDEWSVALDGRRPE